MGWREGKRRQEEENTRQKKDRGSGGEVGRKIEGSRKGDRNGEQAKQHAEGRGVT